jgi:hypothetical protein
MLDTATLLVFKKWKNRQKKQKKNAAAYAAERPLFLDSFLKLKIRGLYTRAASNRERLMMSRVR